MSWVRIPLVTPKKSLIIERLLRIFLFFMHPKFAFPLFFAIFVLIINPKTNSLNMKNDQYFPHEVSTRSNSQVINLIEAEGAAGYGFYWALLEYLRAQDHYTGDIRVIKSIARQMKIRIDKATRILNDYELFIVENTLFSSPMLIEKMLPLERKRAKVCLKNDVSASEAPCNLLEINSTSFKEEKRIEEKRRKDNDFVVVKRRRRRCR